MSDKSTSKPGGVWPTESLDAKTIFGAPTVAPRAARFRSLTLVRAAAPRFDEGEPRGALKIRLARMFEERRVDALRRREPDTLGAGPGTLQDPFLYTFLAHESGQFVGSLGVRLDSGQGWPPTSSTATRRPRCATPARACANSCASPWT